MGIHKCRDSSCKSTHCILFGPNLQHGKLFSRHFSEWASAWVSLNFMLHQLKFLLSCVILILMNLQAAEKEGIDANTPPTGGIFDFQATQQPNNNTTDIDLLAARRLRTNTNSNSAPSVQMNFEGLADVLRVARGHDERPADAAHAAPQAQPAQATRFLPPRMALADFCLHYQLSATTAGKLSGMEVAGPHILRLLSDEDLMSDGKLSKAQIAEVRDGEERWLADVTKVPQ